MSSSTTLLLLHQPTIQFSPSSSSSFSSHSNLKSVKPFSFPTSNLLSSSRLAGRWSPYTMTLLKFDPTPKLKLMDRGINMLIKRSPYAMTRSSTEAFVIRNKDYGDGDEDEDGGSKEALIGGGFMAQGLQATLNQLSRWIIVVVFGAIVVCRHDLVAVWFAGGAALNNFISLLLKRILNQERPDANLRSDPGMPSSHAQNIFYVSTFAVISILELLGINRYTILASCVTLSLASYFTWLRVSQQLHTVSQITVGGLLGTVIGISWYCSWHGIAKQAFESMPWVRGLVILGAAAACINIIVQVIRHWFSLRN